MQSIRFLASRLPLAGRPFSAAALTADYSPVCEQQVNQQINNELGASQAYVALGVHFAAVKVQLFGFASFFLLQADEERDHAASFIRFQHMRGARVCLGAIEAPDVRLESGSLEKAFGVALAVEQKNLQSLFELHRVARAENDEMLAGFVGGDCLSEQIAEIAQLNGMLTRVRLASESNAALGAFLIDQEMSAKYKYSGPLARILDLGEP